MRLVLLRHGIAIDRDDPVCPPDPERALTEKGRERTHAAARGLDALGVAPDLIFSSPYLRARETAQIAADVLRFPAAGIDVLGDLLPDAPAAPFAARIRELRDVTILAAGHAPNLDLILAEMLGTALPFTSLRKAGAALIEDDGDGRTLKWLLEPRHLRKLGK
jgi:phosphohistidine phosphatase